MNRSNFIKTALTALGLSLAGIAPTVGAQNFPERPIRIIVPFSAGSAVDVIARTIGAQVSEQIGQAVVIENKPGANGMIGADIVTKSPADGYTLFLPNDGMMAANPALYPKLSYDPIKDFAPVTFISSVPLVLVVNNEFPARNVAELLAMARAKPGTINFSSSGTGSAQHLPMEFLMAATGTKMTHVPYKALGPALQDLLAGHVPVMFAGLSNVPPLLAGGKLRVLAVSTSKRTNVLPNAPTLIEAGVPGYHYAAWNGIVAPAGTPAPVIQRLHSEFARAMSNPALRSKLASAGFDLIGSGPAEFAELIRTDFTRVGNIIRAAGIKAE